MKTVTVEMHDNCVELASGIFRIAVTTDIGPRIIGGYIDDSENIFHVTAAEPFPNADTGFCLYGGHRLWHSPEAMPRSYAPDNQPVAVEEKDNGVEFTAPVEKLTGIQKRIFIEPLGSERFRVVHTLINQSVWTIEVAPWALSVMAPGGYAVIPQQRNTKGNPFVPDRQLVLWPYSDFNDPRLEYADSYFFLNQDAQVQNPVKIGFNAERGWIAYVNQGFAFAKSFEHYVDAEYPDNGCSIESYSCDRFLEIETVAPLYDLEPDEEAEHVEYWTGIERIPEGSDKLRVADHIAAVIGR